MLVEIKQNTTRGWCYEGVGLVVAGAEAKQGMREGVEGSSIDNTLVYPNTPPNTLVTRVWYFIQLLPNTLELYPNTH